MDIGAYKKYIKQQSVTERNKLVFKRFVILEKTKKFPSKVGETLHSMRMSLGF